MIARSEIALGSKFRDVKSDDFSNTEDLRQYIVSSIRRLRKLRQKGIIAKYDPDHFDPYVRDFVKIGEGSLGGKGRGLAFMSALLEDNQDIYPLMDPWAYIPPNTIFVDDDAPPEWYDATHVRTIQEGIDNASIDDIVFVFNGTYFENVVADKTINLIGEDENSTIIDGSNIENVITVTSDFITICGFTIQNSGNWGRGINIICDYTCL